jgi:hypothetical protein
MLPRQARLRTPFSDWYPNIPPDRWHHALWTREMAIAQLRKGGPQWQTSGRVLPDQHFEFQGGNGEKRPRGDVRRVLLPTPRTGVLRTE